MKKSVIPEVCEGCKNWESFGKECWVYWDLKKECSQHSQNWGNHLLRR